MQSTNDVAVAFTTDLSPEPDLEQALRRLADMVLSDETTDSLLGAVTALAQRSLPGCCAASISLVQGSRTMTPVCAGDVAREVDSSQYDTGEGPCLEAIRRMDTVLVDSYADLDEWPRFRELALRTSVRSSLSLPLVVGGDAVGALNLYAESEGAFAGQEEAAGQFARAAAVTLANAQALYRAEEAARQLHIALEHRDVIGQAKGMLMATNHITADDAFDILRRASQRSNRKLYDLAQDLVERRNGTSL